ncbi:MULTISPECIES: beta-ketoacyl-ACP synthase II [Ruminococcus]|uniref:3-oxoacyl-[acyl-carrier-protein] synthase 2 n=1 Tax=Ruminococcus albus (strain ATCC 27210 / DSM 20455 / JCM 14654 / NCDO 2250 / 7) TaxID=697329 RepID=E6UF82_RUMA7|nr:MULTISPECIES: beta-ketoacyl-ACP synthase II [Ruminococcus]ADU23609.1 3-oxoacyl-(acyl-carrier-protein) synthase 2 [Ruminococcus albus 7 = DSM 20455]MCR5020547.1 beta-ketoacyl-ACP synthase II [Ruminococcus sp.]
MSRRVVITGMGTVNPLGKNVDEFWENIKANKIGLSYVDQFDASDFPVKIVGAVKDFDPSAYIDKKEARRMDRFTQFALYSAKQALENAGSDLKDIDPYRVGVIIGVGIGGLNLTEAEVTKFNEKPDKVSVFFIPMMIGNMAAGTVAMKTGFKGDNYCTTTACASATHAIGEAFRKIKDGYLDACICGGSEACISRFSLSGFNNMKALSQATELDKASTPFDAHRQGFVLGEGAGMLVLEEYEHAKARGANIIAEIAGYGASGDAFHMTSPSPEGDAAAHAMKMAYTEAGLAPEDVTYINAHGTSTGLNDKYETKAVKLALGEEAARKTVINSTKSMIGHLLGAAGGVEAIITALSVKNDFVHRTVGYTTPDPECDLDYVTEGNREMTVKAALSNSLGFGGHNATICIKKCD